MKKGFTLVELSIVLVIIGLLIGGILVAQSMIGTAKIQAQIRQLGQFDAAVENFQTKYNQLPGDTNLMGEMPGNNDGIIDQYGERRKFWADLSKTGFTKSGGGSYIDDISGNNSGLAASEYLPRATIGNDAYVTGYNYIWSGGNGPQTDYGNHFVIGGVHIPLFWYDDATALKPAEALALDVKMDNGIANTGEVRSTPPGSDCYDGADYKISDDSNVCALVIRMGLSTGNLH